jgi:hypothetical protein
MLRRWYHVIMYWLSRDVHFPTPTRIRAWVDRKLRPPMVQTMLGPPRKNPACKDPMCGKKGIRKDVRMGKVMGGGPCYCHCVIIETVEKNRVNRWRLRLGLEAVK